MVHTQFCDRKDSSFIELFCLFSCDSNPEALIKVAQERYERTGLKCLIYSVGSRGDFSFEIAFAEYITKISSDSHICEIHVFDPKDFSHLVPSNLTHIIRFHAWGLKPHSDVSKFDVKLDSLGNAIYSEQQNQTSELDSERKSATTSNEEYVIGEEYLSLQQIVQKLGHQARIVDVFKIDCEYCEWDTYQDWLMSNVDIRQIQAELHHAPPVAIEFFTSLQHEGYVTFHKEPNIQYDGGNCQEYAFLKLDQKFFI